MVDISRKSLFSWLYEVLLVALVIAATVGRLLLIVNHWPVTNSDEGNMGIMALHIAYNGDRPLLFYGQLYMGPVEGYIAALFFHLAGPSLTTLRLASLPFAISFLVGLYFLTRLLYTRGLALASVLLLSLGSDELLTRQLKTVGEYPGMMACTVWICLLVAWLTLTSTPWRADEPRTTWQRMLVYALLGLITGLALWIDWIILPFVMLSVIMLLLFCRHELRSRAGLALLIGLILGMMPLIIYNVTAPLAQNSLSVFLHSYSSPLQPTSNQLWRWLQQISGTVTMGLPFATGYSPLCSPQTMPFFGPVNAQCLILQGGWGLGYLVLLALALCLAGRAFWQIWAPQRQSLRGRVESWTPGQRQAALRQGCRLLLLLGTALTLLSYARSAQSAVYPITSARYLTCLLATIPAILWPLWRGLRLEVSDYMATSVATDWRRWIGLTLRLACLALIAGTFLTGTLRTIQEVPGAQRVYQEEGALVEQLIKLGATHVYSEYWTCNRLIFRSQERVICAALDEKLRPGYNRYPPYEKIVQQAIRPAYVFPIASPQAQAFAHHLETSVGKYTKITQYGYVIYIPT